MKKVILAAILLLLVAGTAHAEQTIGFISVGDTLQGVDGNTVSWSSSDFYTANLQQSSWSLLGGSADVYGLRGLQLYDLSHRGTRGLGVWGRENDEIDSYGSPESIVIAFDQPHYLNSFEVRSLFYEPNLWTSGVEEGNVAFLLGTSVVGQQHLTGTENIQTAGTLGVNSFSYANPYIVDKVIFYVPWGQSYTSGSEFAVAKLGVTAVPEPISTILFLTGGTMLAVRRLRRK